MNKKKILTVALLATVLVTGQVFGQYRQCDGCMGLPGLTENQKEQIQVLHTKTQKNILPLTTELEVYHAELKQLMVADSPDKKAIDKKIDAISGLRKQIQKSRIMSRLGIRNLLTSDQRIHFDMRAMSRCGHGSFHGERMHHGDMMGKRMKFKEMGHYGCRRNKYKTVEVIRQEIEE